MNAIILALRWGTNFCKLGLLICLSLQSQYTAVTKHFPHADRFPPVSTCYPVIFATILCLKYDYALQVGKPRPREFSYLVMVTELLSSGTMGLDPDSLTLVL